MGRSAKKGNISNIRVILADWLKTSKRDCLATKSQSFDDGPTSHSCTILLGPPRETCVDRPFLRTFCALWMFVNVRFLSGQCFGMRGTFPSKGEDCRIEALASKVFASGSDERPVAFQHSDYPSPHAALGFDLSAGGATEVPLLRSSNIPSQTPGFWGPQLSWLNITEKTYYMILYTYKLQSPILWECELSAAK